MAAAAAATDSSMPVNNERGHSAKSFPNTAAYLADLSAEVMKAHTSGDDRILLKHLSADFEMVNNSVHECGVPGAANREQHLANVAQLKTDNPQWVTLPTNVSVQLEKGANTAQVWMTMRGCDGDDLFFNRESVSIFYWRRQASDGMWICYRHASVRGGGDTMNCW